MTWLIRWMHTRFLICYPALFIILLQITTTLRNYYYSDMEIDGFGSREGAHVL